MIPQHAQFLTALRERKKVCVRFYSKPDSGVLDRVCAPLDYGPGENTTDGLNRYWLWDYASETDFNSIGLVPQQILDLQMLGEGYDPAEFSPSPRPGALTPPTTVSSAPSTVPIL